MPLNGQFITYWRALFSGMWCLRQSYWPHLHDQSSKWQADTFLLNIGKLLLGYKASQFTALKTKNLAGFNYSFITHLRISQALAVWCLFDYRIMTWKRHAGKQTWNNLRFISAFTWGLRKVIKHQSDIRHPGQDLIQPPLKYLLKVFLLLLTFYFWGLHPVASVTIFSGCAVNRNSIFSECFYYYFIPTTCFSPYRPSSDVVNIK
jgi:hypothetical protein